MTFFLRKGWQVQFTEGDLKTPLPRTFTFANPEKIRELAGAEKRSARLRLGTCWITRLSRGAGACGYASHLVSTGRSERKFRLPGFVWRVCGLLE
jgi:hypothetical protein